MRIDCPRVAVAGDDEDVVGRPASQSTAAAASGWRRSRGCRSSRRSTAARRGVIRRGSSPLVLTDEGQAWRAFARFPNRASRTSTSSAATAAKRRHGDIGRTRCRCRQTARARPGAVCRRCDRRIVDDRRPVDFCEIGVDRVHALGARADKRERFESAVRNQPIHQHRRRERVQLSRLVVELHLPEKLQLALLHGVFRQPRIGSHPRRTLRVALARGPLAAAASLRVHQCGTASGCDHDGAHQSRCCWLHAISLRAASGRWSTSTRRRRQSNRACRRRCRYRHGRWPPTAR